MSLSLFISKIIGPCLIVAALGMLINRNFFREVMEDFCKNATLVFFSGMTSIVIGLLIVITHNIWVMAWPVMITVFGWTGVFKGIWLIIFPNTVCKFMQFYIRNKKFLLVHSFFVLFFGVILTILGYCS